MTDTIDAIQAAGLNRSQKKFCKMARTHNIRLLAPAGSGKTYSLLWRCRFITDECEKNGSPQPRFLILTFTRAARFELEDRMKKNPAFAGIHATVRTLNSWGWEQYRRAGKTFIVSNKDRKDLATHDLLSLCKKYAGLNLAMSTKQKQNKYAGDIIDLIESGAGYEQNQEIKIHLMTATRSKGHEYDAVIILDVDDDEWPNRLTDNIEEERRLFYVAMTRARKYLYFAVSGGKLESRFLLEARVI